MGRCDAADALPSSDVYAARVVAIVKEMVRMKSTGADAAGWLWLPSCLAACLCLLARGAKVTVWQGSI